MTYDEQLHSVLTGQPGSRAALNTPVLILDLDALERNIALMAARAARDGIAMRPHAKTHKSADIARRQLDAGAIGICCAKLGEAEALAANSITGLHLTSPVVSKPAIARLAALAAAHPDISVVVDHPANVERLGEAMRSTSRALDVIIDIDPGFHRTGVADADAAVRLAHAIADLPGLRYRGVQFYCGADQHIADYAQRAEAIRERTAYLSDVIDKLTAAGFPPAIVTGSGTGSHEIDLELGVFTELQVGSYIFMDRQYAECDLTTLGMPALEHSLFIDSTVVSANTAGLVTVDAGFKAMATDGGLPTIANGAPPQTRFAFMGDEQGALIGSELPPLGARVSLIVPHCDPTVNLYDSFHVVRQDTLVDIWPITARGRSQ